MKRACPTKKSFTCSGKSLSDSIHLKILIKKMQRQDPFRPVHSGEVSHLSIANASNARFLGLERP